jgi:nucleoside-diphosphate-sugar epimerase
MRVAVTGAKGFIGRHVLSELARHAVEVVAFDKNVLVDEEEPLNPNIVHLDIGKFSPHTYEWMGRPDVLIHLAWGGLPHYRSLHHFEQELPHHYRFLSHLVRDGLPGLVATGTCFEYGMQSGELIESMDTRPDNPYGMAKDVLRRQLEHLREKHPFSFSWARLFYLYGEGQAESSLLPQLKLAVKQGRDTFNMSGGEQLRDYLPVSDIAANLVRLAINKADIGVVNICSGKPISIRRLVESWIEDNGWSIGLNLGHYPYPDYEPFAFWGNRGKLDDFIQSLL